VYEQTGLYGRVELEHRTNIAEIYASVADNLLFRSNQTMDETRDAQVQMFRTAELLARGLIVLAVLLLVMAWRLPRQH